MKCHICGATGTTENDGWDQIKVYHFNIYPDELVVLTNAPRKEFDKAVDIVGQSHEEGYAKNIDEVLRSMGFLCLAGCNASAITVTL